ncbi:MAG: aldehyde dehydrogenase family protein, partial [Candidatus Carbobacillus sp.]|nr:aldehyde dehydrogenase family protein [Candidatus Carbobacillus sp.]
MQILKNFVGGEWVALNDRQRGEVYNPATGEVIAEVPFSTAADIDRAVAKAAEAYDRWRKVPVIKRTRYMFQYLEIVRREREALARMVTTEHGKSYVDALAEVDRGIESLEHAVS